MADRILKIPQAVVAEMWGHGLEEYPNECCGLLAGKSDVVHRLFRIRNSLKSPTRFMMDSKDQYAAFKQIDREGLELQVIYHSHTMSPAYPSGTDLELAVYPELNYLLMSFQWTKPVQKEPFPETRAYWIRAGKIEPARAELI